MLTIHVKIEWSTKYVTETCVKFQEYVRDNCMINNPYKVIIQNPVAMATFNEALVNEPKAKLLPSPVKSGSKYMSFTEAYDSPESKEVPDLPVAGKSKTKFKMGFSPNPRNSVSQKKCFECGTPRMVFAKRSLSGAESRELQTCMNDMDDFTCGSNISGVLNEKLKAKGVCVNRNLTCADPIESIYYRKINYDNVCAWCKKPLSEESVQKLQHVLTTHSTVQPNCGEQGCLRRNCGGSDGWTIKRPKKPKIPKAKPKSKEKKRKKPAGGEPPEKRRKE